MESWGIPLFLGSCEVCPNYRLEEIMKLVGSWTKANPGFWSESLSWIFTAPFVTFEKVTGGLCYPTLSEKEQKMVEVVVAVHSSRSTETISNHTSQLAVCLQHLLRLSCSLACALMQVSAFCSKHDSCCFLQPIARWLDAQNNQSDKSAECALQSSEHSGAQMGMRKKKIIYIHEFLCVFAVHLSLRVHWNSAAFLGRARL